MMELQLFFASVLVEVTVLDNRGRPRPLSETGLAREVAVGCVDPTYIKMNESRHQTERNFVSQSINQSINDKGSRKPVIEMHRFVAATVLHYSAARNREHTEFQKNEKGLQEMVKLYQTFI